MYVHRYIHMYICKISNQILKFETAPLTNQKFKPTRSNHIIRICRLGNEHNTGKLENHIPNMTVVVKTFVQTLTPNASLET